MIGLGKPFVDFAIGLHEPTLPGIIAILVSSDNTRPRRREQVDCDGKRIREGRGGAGAAGGSCKNLSSFVFAC